MQGFDQQTLHDLEFNQIKDWLVNYALGETAQKRLSELQPSNNFDAIEKALLRTAEFKRIRVEGESFPRIEFEELLAEIKLLPIQNAVLSQEGFIRISQASDLVNGFIHFFDKRSQDFPELYALLNNVYFTSEIIASIEKVFDRKGQVKSDASPFLAQIRQSIHTVRQQIGRIFDKELRRFGKEGFLGETREAFVNERRVLTVLSTHKRKIGGSVMGSSKTGSLTFIEPAATIPLNNELELLLDDERKEIFRILRELTTEIAHHLPLIEAYHELLTEFDFINAKTKLALDLDAVMPGIVRNTRIELIDAYHPILWKSNKALGKPTFPQHVTLDADGRMLVISGPNAGGKSITLKTIGLLQIMLQAGLLVPVHENSKMCFFQQVLTDIGDNQSIENELSTYSYRLKRMKYFLEVANRRTLLLLDEFGTGSDPELGGALAEVFFERLYNCKSFAVITTHYASIKLKADQLRNALNGCMLFNTETLEPMYKFSIGQPGSSFTFEVAQINGIPMELIEEAKGKLDKNRVKMDHLLSELQKEKTYLERLNKEHIEAQELAEEARQYFLDRKEHFETRLKTQQEFIEKNNFYLNAGKKLKSYIDRFQTRTRKKDANNPLMDEVKKYLLIEKSKIEEAKLKTELMKKPGVKSLNRSVNENAKTAVHPKQQNSLQDQENQTAKQLSQLGSVSKLKQKASVPQNSSAKKNNSTSSATKQDPAEKTQISQEIKAVVTPPKVKKSKTQQPKQDPLQQDKIVVGSTVKMIETKQSGTVEDITGAILTVAFGFMRLKVTRDKLMWVK
jgi:DNA mismatch repair protein MutS2